MKWQLVIASLVLAASCFASDIRVDVRVIGGTNVAKSDYPWMARVKIEGAVCSAALVGPKTFLTAAHCARDGASGFEINGIKASGIALRHTGFPHKKIDVELLILDDASAKQFASIDPVSIQGTWAQGETVNFIGFGCIEKGGTDVPSGNLYLGKTTVKKLDQASATAEGGSGLCFGDSGGPAFTESNGEISIKGVNSQGNLADLNIFSRLDNNAVTVFLKDAVVDHKVEICGINLNCK